MIYTCAEASKLLRRLNEELSALLEKEEQGKSFLAAVGEDPDAVRPAYDFAGTQESRRALEKKIRAVKHAINLFNVTHTVPGFEMTVDQLLILIPQLTESKKRLAAMKNTLPKIRENSSGYGRSGSVIDYRYANYSIADAEKEYEDAAELLGRAQNALDLLNATETMEIVF